MASGHPTSPPPALDKSLLSEAHWVTSCKEGPPGAQSWHHPRPQGLLPSPPLCRLLTVLLGVQAVEPCPPLSPPLTVLIRVQAVKAVGTQENVGLALQGFAKGVAALGYHVVEDAARGEDVHRVGLKRNKGCQMPWRVGELFSPSSRGGGVGRTQGALGEPTDRVQLFGEVLGAKNRALEPMCGTLAPTLAPGSPLAILHLSIHNHEIRMSPWGCCED